MKGKTILRIARPTDHFEEVIRFYTEGLGLSVIGSFENHEGFDGVMLGTPGALHHLEFTQKRGHSAGRAPTQENLLVFYLQDRQEWLDANQRMSNAGYQSVPSFNPYWDRLGKTYEDPDGYRVVLQHQSWPA